jgi:hypothetical protein
MSSFARRFDSTSSQRYQRAERRSSPALAAYHWNGSIPHQDPIRDISSTGAYLLTHERWEAGEMISLTLQRSGPFEKSPEHRISVKVKAVRWDDHGIAVAFVLPEGANLRLWQSPLKSAAEQTEPEDILREFRVAHAIAFLSRICPSASDEVTKLLHEELSNYRLEHAIEIALRAEQLLESAIDADKMQVFAKIAMRIIENGSWSEDPFMLQFWAGLLASSCSAITADESNLRYVDLMSQLNSVHVRVLAGAATRAPKIITGPDRITSRPIACNAADLMRIAGSHDLIRIDRDLDHMAELGLIEHREKAAFFSPIADAKITPTSLGLELYARCNGQRGTRTFYGLVPPGKASLSLEQ